jgi:hypothetical protein
MSRSADTPGVSYDLLMIVRTWAARERASDRLDGRTAHGSSLGA